MTGVHAALGFGRKEIFERIGQVLVHNLIKPIYIRSNPNNTANPDDSKNTDKPINADNPGMTVSKERIKEREGERDRERERADSIRVYS